MTDADLEREIEAITSDALGTWFAGQQITEGSRTGRNALELARRVARLVRRVDAERIGHGQVRHRDDGSHDRGWCVEVNGACALPDLFVKEERAK